MDTRIKYIVWINTIWILFLIWNQAVLVYTPDAMRVDLIIFLPVFGLITLYLLYKYFKAK